ncbi:hypothetical protein AAG906_022013 [Vitis piasezkii]
MKNQLPGQVVRMPINCQCNDPSPSNGALMLTQMRIGSKISETVKGKLRLGLGFFNLEGEENFQTNFGFGKGEKLLTASQCYLSTTTGPIAGLLFISTQRLAFSVSIPLRKINRANQSENVKNPSQKYMEIVTVDNFDFWFMGFLNYQKAFSYLREAISQVQNPLQN